MDVDQFALFDEDEIPDTHLSREVPREVVAHHVKPWTSRTGVTKKMANAVIDAATSHINTSELPLESLDAAFGNDGFMLTAKKLSSEEVQQAINLAPNYHQAEKLLATWLDRRTLTLKSIRSSKLAVTRVLYDGIDVESLKYALKHRTLLASSRELTIKSINEAIANVEADKQAGKLCNEIFHRWYGKYYEERYTQPIGQIMQVLKKALTDGLDPKIVERAMVMTGEEGIPITENSLQYGTVKAKKEEELRERAGSFSEQVGTQKEIASRLFYGDTAGGNAKDYEEMF